MSSTQLFAPFLLYPIGALALEKNFKRRCETSSPEFVPRLLWCFPHVTKTLLGHDRETRIGRLQRWSRSCLQVVGMSTKHGKTKNNKPGVTKVPCFLEALKYLKNLKNLQTTPLWNPWKGASFMLKDWEKIPEDQTRRDLRSFEDV